MYLSLGPGNGRVSFRVDSVGGNSNNMVPINVAAKEEFLNKNSKFILVNLRTLTFQQKKSARKYDKNW